MSGSVQSRMRARVEWRFPLRFLGLATALYALPTYVEPLRSGATKAVLLGVPAASALFGVEAQTQAGSSVTSFAEGAFAYSVTYGCTGVSAIALLVAAIVAYPST